MRFARVPFALATILAATVASAQTPNFAGKWTLVPSPSAMPGGFGGGLVQEAVITQDATAITIKRTSQMGEFTTIYKLDGSESKNTLTVQGNTIDQVSKAKWDGDKLVITTTMNFNGNASESTMVLQLDASGQLVVESTGAGRGGGPPTTTKMTYKKS